jgi:hypothetical protein
LATPGQAGIHGRLAGTQILHPDWRERLRAVILALQSSNKAGIVLSRSFLHLLQSRGVEVPDTPVGEQSRGVVGLAVDRDTGEGFLVPLRATMQEPGRWHCDPDLPFGDGRGLRDLLVGLLDALGPGMPNLATERWAFHVQGGIGIPISGPSMDVAGILAIARSSLPTGTAAGGILANCCALVQPSRAGQGELSPVDHEESKMAAFFRECDGGSLLVTHKASTVAQRHAAKFVEVWRVGSLGELAERMLAAGLLTGLMDDRPLSEQELLAVRLEVARLAKSHEPAKIARLCRAAISMGASPSVRLHLVASLHAKMSACLRQQGDFIDALAACSAAELATIRWASHEERLLLACERAWCLADAHRFHEAAHLLDPHMDKMRADPCVYTPSARRNLWNTSGRVLALAGSPRQEWEECFQQTLNLQREWDPASMGRTMVYLAKALAQAGHHEEALELIGPGATAGEMWSLWTSRCLKAFMDGERGSVTEWDKDWAGTSLGGADLLRSFLFLQLGIQPQRDRGSSVTLLGLAEAIFLGGPGCGESVNGIPRLLGAACRIARSKLSDESLAAPGWFGPFARELAESPEWSGMRDHYGTDLQFLSATDPGTAAIRLLRRVPLL